MDARCRAGVLAAALTATLAPAASAGAAYSRPAKIRGELAYTAVGTDERSGVGVVDDAGRGLLLMNAPGKVDVGVRTVTENGRVGAPQVIPINPWLQVATSASPAGRAVVVWGATDGIHIARGTTTAPAIARDEVLRLPRGYFPSAVAAHVSDAGAVTIAWAETSFKADSDEPWKERVRVRVLGSRARTVERRDFLASDQSGFGADGFSNLQVDYDTRGRLLVGWVLTREQRRASGITAVERAEGPAQRFHAIARIFTPHGGKVSFGPLIDGTGASSYVLQDPRTGGYKARRVGPNGRQDRDRPFVPTSDVDLGIDRTGRGVLAWSDRRGLRVRPRAADGTWFGVRTFAGPDDWPTAGIDRLGRWRVLVELRDTIYGVDSQDRRLQRVVPDSTGRCYVPGMTVAGSGRGFAWWSCDDNKVHVVAVRP